MKKLFHAGVKKSYEDKNNRKFNFTAYSFEKKAVKCNKNASQAVEQLKIIGMPVKKKIFTVNRSPCGQNKSKEQFLYNIYTTKYSYKADPTLKKDSAKHFKNFFRTNLTVERNTAVKWCIQQ